MRNFAEFLKTHYLGFVLALLVGLILVSPQLYLIFDLGKQYQGIYLSGVDGHVYYPRIHEVYEGNYKATSAGVYEYKNLPYTFPPGPEITVNVFARLFRLDVSQMIIFSNFLFPFLLYLVFYFLFLNMSDSKLIALSSAAAIILLSNFVFFPKNFSNFFFHPSQITIIPYNRPIHPQVSSVYFYLWLLWFWLWLKLGKGKYLILAGLMFGLLFFIYPFAWMLAVAIQGLLVFYFLLNKNFEKSKSILLSVGIGLIVSIPYWVNFFHLIRHPLYSALIKHNGFYNSREPLFGALLVLDLIFLGALYRLKKLTLAFLLTAVVIVSGIILTNQQVITNFRFFPGHWYWYYITPFSIFLTIFTIFSFLSKRKILVDTLAIMIIALGLVSGAISQQNYYRAEKTTAYETQRYAKVFEWFQTNSLPQSVVLAADPFALMLPAFTANNHYLVDVRDVLSLIPEDRIRHSFFVKIYLEGAGAENIDQYINQKTPDLIQVLYGYYRRYAYGCTECYPEEDLIALKQEYLEFLKKDFQSELKKYKIDYVVIDRQNNKWSYQDLKFISPVAEVNDFLIFKVI